MAGNAGRMSLSVSADKQAKLDAIAANAKRSLTNINVPPHCLTASHPHGELI